MNILIISPVFPYPLDEGAKERIFQVIKGLSRRNKIHLISFYRDPQELQHLSRLNDYCVKIDTVYNPAWSMSKTILFNLLYLFSPTPTLVAMHRSREMRRCIEHALANNHYDIIQIELTQMAHYHPGHTRAATVLVEHDVTFISRRRRLAHAPNPWTRLHWLIQYLKLKRYETAHCRRFDLLITPSKQTRAELERYCPESRISIVRTCVDLDGQPVSGEPGVCRRILFLGSLSHWPNQDAVLYFYNTIFPLIKGLERDVELLIVGKDPEKAPAVMAGDKAVHLLGFVDDVRPLLAGAVSIAPIRYGSGTRTKILRYLACGSPVVSTSLGAEGIDVTHGEDILLADEPQEFATAVINLMKDAELRRRIAVGGYNLAKEEYQWDKSVHELQKEYVSVLEKKHNNEDLPESHNNRP